MLNNNVIKMLNDAKNNNKLAHLYLLDVPKEYSCDNDLLNIINIINNQQLDSLDENNIPFNIKLIDGSYQSIKKESLDNLFYQASFYNHKDLKQLLILKEINNCSIQGLNSILKSIEEPTDNTIIILTTSDIANLLPTIISRAQVLKLQAYSAKDIYAHFIGKGFTEPFGLISGYLTNDLDLAYKYVDDQYIALFDELLSLINDVQKNPYALYHFLNQNISKDDMTKTNFLLKSIKLILQAQTKIQHTTKNKYVVSIYKINNKLLKHNQGLMTYILDINQFYNAIKNDGNFTLHKEVLLLKLMEYYG
ncbi:DNA polymerase III delta prime subunit [Mycoplasma sp. NEAQ87857]|uniref:hypothetical protein n=1 Tax=Mycoplasma sp. NEAQ87857 TaxID=2683967 RepID=UPI0013196209|nr:hypothetical protein [Mycoplasma sp. NEAQ87857]QGZ97898.1 DNA polymerase III delta prime subunit [Mycoplasma sp. NEAQ87857]